MRIDSPKVSNLTFQTGSAVSDSSFTGSFSGSFTGIGNFTGLTADSVEYANVLNKPSGLVSGSSSQARSQIGVAIGTDVQAFHANLTDISNLNPTDSTFIVGAGSSFTLESGNTVRTSLGLGSLATLNTNSSLGSVDLSGNTSYSFVNLSNKPTLVSGSASDVRTFLNVENGATADQTASEIRDLVEAATDSNVFTDALNTKLGNIEANATADQTASEIKSLYEGNADTNEFSDAEQSKLAGIAASATNTATPAIESDGSSPSLASGISAAEVRSLISVDAAGTDNSTDVSLGGSLDYITISGQTITRNAIDLTADVTGDLPISEGGTGASTAAAARSNLGVDAAGTDNSTDVTLAGTRNYITISGQTITRNVVDISDDTNLAVSDTSGQTGINLTLSGDTISGVVSGLTTTSDVQFNDVTVAGDLTVTGTTTSINSTNLDVTDKLIAVNRGGSTAASADGGGLFISGANESLTWDNGNSRFTFSDDLNVGGNITLTGTVDGRDVASDGSKLDGIATNANNYVHPSFDGDDINIDTGALTGATVVSDIDFNITTNTSGHVTDANGSVNTRTLTLSDLGYSGDADANNYSHPTAAGDDIDIDTGALTGATVISDLDLNITTNTLGHVTDANGTVSTRTLTLSDLGYTGATNANNYSHPTFNGDDISIDTGALTGATVISDLDFNVTTDTNGHVTDANGTVATRTLTLANLGFTGDTDANNITNNNQLTNGAGYTTYSANQTLNNNSNVHFEGLMVGQTSGATANTIRCVGDIVAYYSSDEQFKDNIETLEGALDKIKAIRGVRFDWNDKQDVYEGHDIGVVAQEVEAVLPELVHHREHNDSKAVDYVKLTAVLIEAVKELSAKVDELEGKCDC